MKGHACGSSGVDSFSHSFIETGAGMWENKKSERVCFCNNLGTPLGPQAVAINYNNKMIGSVVDCFSKTKHSLRLRGEVGDSGLEGHGRRGDTCRRALLGLLACNHTSGSRATSVRCRPGWIGWAFFHGQDSTKVTLWKPYFPFTTLSALTHSWLKSSSQILWH